VERPAAIARITVSETDRIYRGRFAPSPTGPLHFGSLVAAVCSYLQARHERGQWLVRMEDLDRPREVPGAADRILRTLEAFGMEWDGPVMYQHTRVDAYRTACDELQRLGVLYGCACTRREIADSSIIGPDGLIYPGTCRNAVPNGREPRAWRVRADDQLIQFNDGLQGRMCQSLATEVGDFVVHRADGLFAYQLAVVVDDAAQGITEIVRGADLLGSTPRQIYLQRLLGYKTPTYVHLPVAVNAQGEKLSKQTLAPSVDSMRPAPMLARVLKFLGQPVPAELEYAALDDIWRWAVEQWELRSVARVPVIEVKV